MGIELTQPPKIAWAPNTGFKDLLKASEMEFRTEQRKGITNIIVATAFLLGFSVLSNELCKIWPESLYRILILSFVISITALIWKNKAYILYPNESLSLQQAEMTHEFLICISYLMNGDCIIYSDFIESKGEIKKLDYFTFFETTELRKSDTPQLLIDGFDLYIQQYEEGADRDEEEK